MPSLMLFAQAATDAAPLELGVRVPLSVMIFLEYAVWGAWYVVLGNYLNTIGFSRKDIGRVYATIPLGAIISPMFVGMVADRYFASEQLLAALHLVGAALLIWMAYIHKPVLFFWVALGYALVYTPTMALSNSVVFANVPTSLDFPEIRVMGTIGWIVAGLMLRLFIKPGQQVNNSPLLLGAALSVALGGYSFFLPHTPPPASGSGAQAKAIMGVHLKVKEPGSGYTSSPTITITGGGGSGAAASAEVENGRISKITVTDPGRDYTSPPNVVVSGGGGAGGIIDASLQIVAVEVVSPGAGYRAKRIIDVISEKGSGAALEAELDPQTGAVLAVTIGKDRQTGAPLGGSGYEAPPTLRFRQPGIPFVDALELLSTASGAVFFGVSFLITIALAFYYAFTALYFEQGLKVKPENIGPLMTIGQWVEIIFMLTLAWFVREWGMRNVLIIGMAAWGVRYAIFAAMPPLGIAILGIALHGICFDFFLAAGMMHTNDIAKPEIRASAQSLFGVLTYGLGMYVGTELAGWLNQYYTREVADPATGTVSKVTDWRSFWTVPCVGALVCLGLFVVFF
ncbi:MAG: MFS transporter [Gemmataceae bacterium]|nr:MFS transporter [Gemmataceae bacterium]